MGVEKLKRNIIRIILVFLVASSIIQCTPKTQIIKEDDEAILERRVQEYWSYRIKGQWDKSYLYESPDYREKTNIVKYINQNGRSVVKWEEFDISELWTSGEEGYAKLNIKYRYLIPKFQETIFARVVEEKWIKKDGQWYHL